MTNFDEIYIDRYLLNQLTINEQKKINTSN